MVAKMEPVLWEDERPATALLSDAQSKGADFLVIQARPETPGAWFDPKGLEAAAAGVIVACDQSAPARRERLRRLLSPVQCLLAALPTSDLAVAISMKGLGSQPGIVQSSKSLCELVVRLGEATSVAWVPGPGAGAAPIPQLTMPRRGPQPSWLRDAIERNDVAPSNGSADRVRRVALKAGLFLLNDFFDDSHACSQSIEGQGIDHCGDYWHAILHRREPDYGNARYWFRHVGRHPAFTELADCARQQLSSAPAPLAEKLKPWRDRLIRAGQWDPMAFVDLCAAAETDADLKAWCERIQYEEMLLVLEAT